MSMGFVQEIQTHGPNVVFLWVPSEIYTDGKGLLEPYFFASVINAVSVW